MDKRVVFLKMDRLRKFQRFHNYYAFALVSIYLFINGLVLATSMLMEYSRSGSDLPFRPEDPFIWQLTSAIATLLLLPIIHFYYESNPFSWQRIKREAVRVFVFAILFSIAHLGLMVGLRKFLYFLQGRSYTFGSFPFEFFYELRKDILTFITILIVIHAYRFIVSRLMGEASFIAEEEPEEKSNLLSGDRLLVKKLGKEFIIKLQNVEWMESSGNYVNLHIKERIYPIRKTLSALSTEIADKGFCRIHRSHAVNLDFIESITPFPSGDGEIKLSSGKILNLSRRYKDELKQKLL